MKNYETSPYFADDFARLQDILQNTHDNLFATQTQSALEALNASYTDTDALIEAAINARNVITIANAGLLDNAAFADELASHSNAMPQWRDHAPLDADVEMQEALGLKLYNVPEDFKDAHVAILLGEGSNHIVRSLIEKIMGKKIPFLVTEDDTLLSRLIFKHSDEDAIKQLAECWMERYDKITHRCVAMPNAVAQCPIAADEAKESLFLKTKMPVAERTRTGEVMFTLTYFPTENDADIDQIPYREYLDLYFAMCDQPDDHIEKANEYLIHRLEQTETVRFTNDDGTDISMSLIDHDGRHFTFANSMTKKNVPGSEVFSAPRRDSLNGTIVTKGRFLPKSDKSNLIIDLTLHFEQGKLVDFDAAHGAEHFKAFLDRDPNNRYVGELGIGTNPHLKRHVANGPLVEKTSKSFHLALGAAYQMTNYLGKPVHLDNGNDSIDHWDITTMLGNMYLDGHAIMQDGIFLPPELDVINRGWAAIPVEDRPDRWKNYQGPYTGETSQSD